jgi:hypothetical protein
MTESEQLGSLEEAMAEALGPIDQSLAKSGMVLHLRPMQAATKFVELFVVEVDDGEKKPPGGLMDFAKTRWFRVIYKNTEQWYRNRFGDAMDAGCTDGRLAMTLILDTPYLLKVPMTTKEPGVPGESFWLCYHDEVQEDENALDWLQQGPIIGSLAASDVKAAHRLATEIATKLRSIHIALLGMNGDEPKCIELRDGILPNLESAARHLAAATPEEIRLAHWDMQMACELALKCLAQQRSGSFKETHDLFYLYDNMPDTPLPFARTDLSKLPNWERMVEYRYGGGRLVSMRQAFRAYRATLNIVAEATRALKRSFQLGKAKFHLKRPPWLGDI